AANERCLRAKAKRIAPEVTRPRAFIMASTYQALTAQSQRAIGAGRGLWKSIDSAKFFAKPAGIVTLQPCSGITRLMRRFALRTRMENNGPSSTTNRANGIIATCVSTRLASEG